MCGTHKEDLSPAGSESPAVCPAVLSLLSYSQSERELAWLAELLLSPGSQLVLGKAGTWDAGGWVLEMASCVPKRNSC